MTVEELKAIVRSVETKTLSDDQLARIAYFARHVRIRDNRNSLATLSPDIWENLAKAFCIFPNDPSFVSFFTKYPLVLNRYFWFTPQATLLYMAIGASEELLQALLRLPALNVNKGNNQRGETPLHKACSTGNLAAVRALLQHPSIDVNRFEHPRFPSEMGLFGAGRSALHLAVQHAHEDIIELLLAHPRIDVNVRDSFGQTAYACAVGLSRKHPENKAYDRILLRFHGVPGIQTDFPQRPRRYQGHYEFRTSALYKEEASTLIATESTCGVLYDAVASKMPIDEFRTLLAHYPAVNRIVTEHRHDSVPRELVRFPKAANSIAAMVETALMKACRLEDEEKVALLLNHPTIDVTQFGSLIANNHFSEYDFEIPNTSFPLMCTWYNSRIAAMILAAPGVQVNQQNVHRETALMLACEAGEIDVVRVLLAVPTLALNLKDIRGATALSLAAKGGHTDVVRLLVADPRLDRVSLRHAALCAAERGHLLTTKVCVGSLVGTEREIRRAKGLVLKRAYQSDSIELVRWLISVGASISKNDFSRLRGYKRYQREEPRRFMESVFLQACEKGRLPFVRHFTKDPIGELYDFDTVDAIVQMEPIEDMEEDRIDNSFKNECIAAGLTEVPIKNSPFGVALRKGCVDIVAYLAEACYLETIKQPLVNVAWMNSMKSKYNEKDPPNLTKWKEYAAHPLVDINYRGHLGRTLLMKAISDYHYDPYAEALLTFPSINTKLEDDSGKMLGSWLGMVKPIYKTISKQNELNKKRN